MIQHKKYLAGQAWCTPLANMVLLKGSAFIGLSSDFNSFIPGLAVVVSHFFLLALTFINVPSQEDVRVAVDLRRSRKNLNKLKSQPGTTPEQVIEIDSALAALRSKEIAKCISDVDHSLAIYNQALQEDTEKT
ncbi:hypothetical protein D8682_25210 [Buttiauxella sp. 3AFRM03]|uniref:hypothetical protein n=1 Tax=Buttiauxella sp. 3AFRM03 TaxID=2479367 RepID=UPI000EF7718D|nr:hypothetical protein [Buttiauxella sp. 3AFRM03]AYN29984.1 hypothetical protein D8682_25210 [Buttiauxella sp. 3AFRM03]